MLVLVTVTKMMDTNKDARILADIIKGYRPPAVRDIIHSYNYHNQTLLIRIDMRDPDHQVFGFIDQRDNIWLIDEFEWVSKGGLYVLAAQRGIKRVED